MGYFSSGSEGRDYEARYCDRCAHNRSEGETYELYLCPVWQLHEDWNREQLAEQADTEAGRTVAEEKRRALLLFIPVDARGFPQQCAMFTPRDPEQERVQRDRERQAAREAAWLRSREKVAL